jgi:aminoglycoside phosphotransferase (APT) family kinase protein
VGVADMASVARLLQAALAPELGAGVQIEGLGRLTGGSSRDIWGFRAVSAAGDQQLVLRMDGPGELRPEGLRQEADVMAAAARAGVPVPRVLAVVLADTSDGQPGLIMERVDGETAPRRIIEACQASGTSAVLARQCGAALGRLHKTGLTGLPALGEVSRLSTYRTALDRLDPNRPVLELAFRYLVDEQPPARPDVLVHGDFRLGNLVVGSEGLRAVLDWESSHAGDALEDVGWIAIRAWRFRGAGPVGGFGDVEDFLTAYGEQADWVPSPAEFHWALILNTWIWAVGCLEQAERHLSGSRRSVDLAVVGRRVIEIEHDLLELLP